MAAVAMILPYLAQAGAVLGAIGQIQAGDSARQAANTNADTKRQAAAETNRQATDQIEMQRQRARSVIGQQLASTSESGTGLSGSNLDLLNQSLMNNELDSLNIRHGANLNASGLNTQANNDNFQGSQAQTGGYLSAAGTLLNAGGRTYTQAGSMLPKGPG